MPNMNMGRLSNSTIDENVVVGELLELWRNIEYTAKEDPMKVEQNQTDFSVVSTTPTVTKPAQNIPLRCHSEPISHPRNIDPQVDESYCSVNIQDWKNLSKQLQPNVSFSEVSTMYVYYPDPHCETNKAYTKKERKGFVSEAMSEAIRIKWLILSTPGTSTKDSFKSLLKNNTVSLEEVVGIEHLALNRSVSKLLKERQDHNRAILSEQSRQHRAGKMQDDHMTELGEFSASRSVKSVKQARMRATMAACLVDGEHILYALDSLF